MFCKGIENTVEKGEIARYDLFLLSHCFFKRLVLQTSKNQGLFGKGLIIIFLQIESSSIRMSSSIMSSWEGERERVRKRERLCDRERERGLDKYFVI